MGSASKVLIVDDDDDVRNGLARALEITGRFEVRTAADGFEAGYQFAAFAPQLVILDIVMPGMEGLDICRRMRALARDAVKVVVLTGHPGNSREMALIVGADLLLTKPQSIDKLLDHLDDLRDE